MQALRTATLTQPLTEDTAFLITDAGMQALRLTDAPAEMTEFDAQSAGDERNAPDVTTETPAETFTPDTPEKVDWVLGKIADARARAARIRENMELMAKEAERDADRLEWQFGPALQAFTRQQTEGGRKKSVRLPNGVLGYRTKPAGVNIGDTRAALEWARVNLPDAVTETVDRATIVKTLLETGEAVDFAAFTPAEEQFYIK